MKTLILAVVSMFIVNSSIAQCCGKNASCHKGTNQSNNASSQNYNGKIKVSGNCDMCKTRIEEAAMKVNGVTAANWNVGEKILYLNFDETKTNQKEIAQAVADSGHDTEQIAATKKSYTKLPACCKYRK